MKEIDDRLLDRMLGLWAIDKRTSEHPPELDEAFTRTVLSAVMRIDRRPVLDAIERTLLGCLGASCMTAASLLVVLRSDLSFLVGSGGPETAAVLETGSLMF